MTAIILSIGDELVLGQTIDTNSAWLSQHLAAAGCDVAAHVTVADNQRVIEDAIKHFAARCNLLIVSGGIGPTADDLTRQALAAVLGVRLRLDEAWLSQLKDFFVKLGRTMPPTNEIQAMIPEGVALIPNSCGTAAGLDAYVNDSCRVVVMPGVPREMKAMFTSSVLPTVAATTGGATILSRTLHTFGLGESAVAERLGALMNRDRNPSVGTTVSNGIVSIRITARFASRDEAQTQLDATTAACASALGDLIFGADEETLQSAVAKLLLASSRTIATAESCTGGLLAKMLTDTPGSSTYFKQGWVTYSNNSKRDRLGVSENILNVYGAVSEPTVIAMAAAARRLAKTDFALSISGIAGPDGGTDAKPVGTVCIALAAASAKPTASAVGSSDFARTFHFPADRETIRDRAAKMALTMLRFHLLAKPLPF